MLFNKRNGTLYTGVTSDLIKRIHEHKSKEIKGFSKDRAVDKLGYFEVSDSIADAIVREKQIKSGSRNKKLALIEEMNPNWIDLYPSLIK
ncbi:MAG: GIY-YIG nuclease family protein [Coriobacteriia bacterium]|nr:GIY-YIG nuclease family protein [Coriobacteriia bacterium]